MKLDINEEQLCELFQLMVGAFRPQFSFMNEEDFYTCVNEMRLANGILFPLPITFSIDDQTRRLIGGASTVHLSYQSRHLGYLEIDDIFNCDKGYAAKKIYGTTEKSHPGVAAFLRGGDWFIGGRFVEENSALQQAFKGELTPVQTKSYFKSKGWTTVAGFQTRNVPHRAHEYLQRIALENVDGLFIQPLIGKKKAGDYTPEAIIKGYKVLIDEFLPKSSVAFGTLRTAMRYAGPREAMFHAIIRRNYGCTHFIVGRDHAGVSDFYLKYEAQDLCKKYEDELNIKILGYKGPFYCNSCGTIATEKTCNHYFDEPTAIEEISGTKVRQILLGGENPNVNWMRPEIINALKNTVLFIEGNS